jgi:carbon-monoxide dehydrogenase medium subunit
MQDFDFYPPHTLEQACRELAHGGGRLIAGGTDLHPQINAGLLDVDRLIDLSRLGDLRYIAQERDLVHVGALTTHAQMSASPLLCAPAAALAQAASCVGAVQTRNRGTLGGNIANASPAGDALPPLLALDACVTLVSVDGERTLPLTELLLGPGETSIAAHEVIHHVSFRPPVGARSVYFRLGKRKGQAISIASAAVVLRTDGQGRVDDVRIALGAVAPTAIRCPESEAALVGQRLGDEEIAEAARLAAQACDPIDDLRATARYRRHAVVHLVGRALIVLAGQA